jgi:hypothetical protein
VSIENIVAQNAAATAQVSGQGGTALDSAAPPAQQQAAPPVQQQAAQTAAITPQPSLTLTPEQWASYATMQKRIADFEAIENKRAAEAKEAEIKALQAKGQIEQAFSLQRQQAATELAAEQKKLKELEDRAKRYALDGELARALAEKPLVPGGAEQLTQLWRGQFNVEPQGDSFSVRSQDFQPVGQWIAAQLGRPEYAHFLRPQNPHGGTASSGTVQSAQGGGGQQTGAAQPKNLGEAIALQMAGIAKQHAADATTSGGSTLNDDGGITRLPAAGFGLRPAAR